MSKEKTITIKTPLISGVLLMLFVVIAAIIFHSFLNQSPVIYELIPTVAMPGDQIHISGENFGKEKGSGSLLIANRPIPQSMISLWEDNQIIFTFHGETDSATISVETENGKSPTFLLTNRIIIPVMP